MPDTPEKPAQQSHLTVDDILNAGLNDLLDQDPDTNYSAMSGLLAKAAKDADDAGDVVKVFCRVD